MSWKLLPAALAALLLLIFDENTARVFYASAIAGYLLYEIMHLSYHLPNNSFVEKVPGWRQLRRLHLLHHRRELMTRGNFNLTLPLFDWLLGTLVWEEEDP